MHTGGGNEALQEPGDWFLRFQYKITMGMVAVLYGAILAGLPVGAFKDRENYVSYVENSSFILENRADEGVLPLLANEPLWLAMNAIAGSVLEPENALRLFIFLSASIFAYFFITRYPSSFWWLLAFLFLPQILKNYVVHLRQGVAISVFIVGWNLTGQKRRWAVMLLAPFIHASFFFVVGLILMVQALAWLRFTLGLRGLIYAAAGIAAAILTSVVAALLGARQAFEYTFSMAGVSGVGFIFWLSILGVFMLQGREFLRENTLSVSIIVFYLCTYFFLEVSGRIFESALFLVLFAGLQTKGWWRVLCPLLIVVYGALAYVASLGQPWLGFGN